MILKNCGHFPETFEFGVRGEVLSKIVAELNKFRTERFWQDRSQPSEVFLHGQEVAVNGRSKEEHHGVTFAPDVHVQEGHVRCKLKRATKELAPVRCKK